MKIRYKFRIFAYVGLMLVVACSHYDELQKNPRESSAGGKSHNAGENCGSCHNQQNNEAGNDGWWTVAGTVFRSSGSVLPNATMELWEKPGRQGRLIKTLKSDRDGNFYTNQILNFNGGCYPAIVNGSNIKSMDTTQFSGGSCNSCHGVSRDKITID